MTGLRRASDEVLTLALSRALQSVGLGTAIAAVERSENVYESSNLSEVIRCSLQDGPLPPLLCKYGPCREHDHQGLRHGLAYEAHVYRDVLDARYATPRFYGSHQDPERDVMWLFLEYLGEGWQLDLGPDSAIVDAAAMMGELHRQAASAMGPAPPELNRYDRRYFESCLHAAGSMAIGWRERVPGFDHLVERFADHIGLLLSAPQTLVHGEFTPHNVVWAEERPYIVDWEQAGLGAGEIDLAALTDAWEEEFVEAATAAYVRARWPGGGPSHDFRRTLEAGRLYWLFRWLADPDEAGTDDEVAWLVERAEDAARRSAG